MCCLGTWFSGGFGDARLIVGHHDLKGLFQPKLFYDSRYKEDIFYNDGGETLEQVAQRCCRCPIPGNIQGQVGRGSE